MGLNFLIQSCEALMKLLAENQIESRPLDRVDDSECGHGDGLKVERIDEMRKRQRAEWLKLDTGEGGGGDARNTERGRRDGVVMSITEKKDESSSPAPAPAVKCSPPPRGYDFHPPSLAMLPL